MVLALAPTQIRGAERTLTRVRAHASKHEYTLKQNAGVFSLPRDASAALSELCLLGLCCARSFLEERGTKIEVSTHERNGTSSYPKIELSRQAKNTLRIESAVPQTNPWLIRACLSASQHR